MLGQLYNHHPCRFCPFFQLYIACSYIFFNVKDLTFFLSLASNKLMFPRAARSPRPADTDTRRISQKYSTDQSQSGDPQLVWRSGHDQGAAWLCVPHSPQNQNQIQGLIYIPRTIFTSEYCPGGGHLFTGGHQRRQDVMSHVDILNFPFTQELRRYPNSTWQTFAS